MRASRRWLVRSRLAFAGAVALTVGSVVSVVSTRAAEVKNHGYAVLGDACGKPNAVGAGTPIVKRNSEMICVQGVSGRRIWSPMPRPEVTCPVEGQVWGAWRCAAGRWSDSSPTFNGSMDDAMRELLDAIAWTKETAESATGAPIVVYLKSGGLDIDYAPNLYDHSVVERELTDRLGSAGISVAVWNDKIFVIKNSSEERCAVFNDPWPVGYTGAKTLRRDAAVEIPCPDFGAPTSSELVQMKAIMVRIGDDWYRNGVGFSQFTDTSRLWGEIDAVTESAEWKSLGSYYLGSRVEWSNSLQRASLYFDFGSTCFRYSNDAGVGSVVESWC